MAAFDFKFDFALVLGALHCKLVDVGLREPFASRGSVRFRKGRRKCLPVNLRVCVQRCSSGNALCPLDIVVQLVQQRRGRVGGSKHGHAVLV